MLMSVKNCSCLGYMLSSLRSVAITENLQKSGKNIGQDNSKSIENEEIKRRVQRKQISAYNQRQEKGQVDKDNLRSQFPAQNQFRLSPGNDKYEKLGHNRDIEPESQRGFIHQSQEPSNFSQSNQHQLPTQKSQIIMNDIQKDIDINQNSYLFSSSSKQGIWQLYDKVQLISCSQTFEQYTVKNKSTGQVSVAQVMKSFEHFQKHSDISHQQSIQKFTALYEQQKHHLRCLSILSRNNCRHLLRIIDYQLKPPTINTSLKGQFCSGAFAVIYERSDKDLKQLLLGKQDWLTKVDRKKIIYQIINCINDVHQNRMLIKDLSLSSFKIDNFLNIRFSSFKIQEQGKRNILTVNNQQLGKSLPFLSPEELEQTILTRSTGQLDSSLSGKQNLSFSEESKRDLWKLGIIVTKILTNKFIFSEQAPQKQLQAIFKNLHNQNQQKKVTSLMCTQLLGLSLHQIEVIQNLLKINPIQRVNCKQILNFQYFKNLLDDSCEYSFDQNSQK